MGDLVGRRVTYRGTVATRHGLCTVIAYHPVVPGDQRGFVLRYGPRPPQVLVDVHRDSFTVEAEE